MQDLGTPAEETQSFPIDIDKNDEIVGSSTV
jgi:hypothetical protein